MLVVCCDASTQRLYDDVEDVNCATNIPAVNRRTWVESSSTRTCLSCEKQMQSNWR